MRLFVFIPTSTKDEEYREQFRLWQMQKYVTTAKMEAAAKPSAASITRKNAAAMYFAAVEVKKEVIDAKNRYDRARNDEQQ